MIIVAKDFDYALSTVQNPNNRGQVEVTKNGNSITNLSANAQILTLEKGTKQETASFNTGSGYLCAASSSSNYLRTKDKSDYSSFSIEITEGAAKIIAQGTYTHNILQYYSTNGLFACYASDQKAVVIYKKVGSGTSEKIFASGAA